MNQGLERHSLPVRLTELLEQAIHDGDWTGTLPGHRTLMSHYSVSARTCLAAIDLLEARGVLAHGEKGRRRRILLPPGGGSRPLTHLLMLEKTGSTSGDDRLQLQTFRTAWEESGGRVHVARFDFGRYQRPAALLKEAVARFQADALLLQVAPRPWVDAAVALRPVFLSGGEWRGGGPLAGVGFHLEEEIKRAVERLAQLGHRRIALPLHPAGAILAQAARRGLAAGLGLPVEAPAIALLAPLFVEQVPAAYQEYWKKLFHDAQPTAVILQLDYQVPSLLGHCARHGIRIPQDLSVLCLENSEWLEWCDPAPACMGFPIQAAAACFKKWMRRGCRPGNMQFLPLEYREGATLGPPRSRRAESH